MAKMIAGIYSAGHDRTGNYIQVNTRTAEGESVSLNMTVNVATSLSEMLGLEISKAHKARLASDPTFRQPGSMEHRNIKLVRRFIVGTDAQSGHILFGGEHEDGTETWLPIGAKDLDGILKMLTDAKKAMHSKVTSPRAH